MLEFLILKLGKFKKTIYSRPSALYMIEEEGLSENNKNLGF